MALNAGPSQGFWGRMGKALPTAINSAAQNFGDPRMRGMNKTLGGMMPPGGRIGGPATNMPTPDPGGMPPLTGGPTQGGIVRGPSSPMGGIRFDPSQRNGNTGITGGMFPGSGGMNIQPQPFDQGMQGGLWNLYNQLSQGQQVPQRQMFY